MARHKTVLLILRYLIFGVVTLGYCPQLSADQIYKCINDKGVLIYASSPCPKDVKALSSWAVTAKPSQPQASVLKPDSNGHYLVDGAVNGQAVTFLIDTGATSVALPASVAKDAHTDCKEMVEIDTANGSTQACRVTITHLRFGVFKLDNVDAVIAPNLNQPLLGMSVLKQYKIAQEHDEMRISERP
jgi:clan AA aspartic protease (TIGR02281 family)